jgi:hypothetical protein
MGAGDVARKLFNALASGDADTYFSLVTEDFELIGPTPEPLDAEAWFGIAQLMAEAFPDLNYHFRVTDEHGDHLHVATQLTGTHTGDFDLSPMGMGVIPATGKSFSLPGEVGSVALDGGRVAVIEMEIPDGGGLMGILHQIGVDLG